MGFKFLNKNVPDQPETVEGAYERFHQLVNHQLVNRPLTIDNRPAVFLRLERNRDSFSDGEWNHIIQQQRRQLIEHMWSQGMIMHTIISEDENGFSLRTEINY